MKHASTITSLPVLALVAGVFISTIFFTSSVSAQASDAYARPGNFPIHSLREMTLADKTREKDVQVRIYYPEGTGPFPVIAFSHSVRGNKDMFSEISTHWASHGFVVVHPGHDDEGVRMTEAGMHPSEPKARERLRDIIAVFDSLDQIEKTVSSLDGKLNRDRLAVAGHSYGSFVAMISGGVEIDIGETKNANLGDPRVRCIIPIATSGPGDYGFQESSWNNLNMPVLFINGTSDQRAGRSEDWRMEPYRLSSPNDKFQIIIDGATHQSYGGDGEGTAPYYVKPASTAFLDFCLNDSSLGRNYLENGGFATFAKDGATISFK